MDGVKTGFTDAAGYCLVTSAKKDGMRLITVVLGTSSASARIDASQALLNYGFRFFETHKLYDAGTALASSRVWKGGTDSVSLGLDRIAVRHHPARPVRVAGCLDEDRQPHHGATRRRAPRWAACRSSSEKTLSPNNRW